LAWRVLRGALSERLLRRWDYAGSLGGAHDDLDLRYVRKYQSQVVTNSADLDGTAVDQKTIQGLEGLASTIRLPEGDIGDSSALRVRAIGQLNPLDRTNGLSEVLLVMGKVHVSSSRKRGDFQHDRSATTRQELR
jgi:hypothetical protein